MAKLLQAVRNYGPKLKLGKTAHPNKVTGLMAARTGLNKGEVLLAVEELGEAILFFNSQGIPVKIPGLGTFRPSMDRDGNLRMHMRFDKALVEKMNSSDYYTGDVANKTNIGITNEEYKLLWDQENPDDPMDLP